MVACVLFELQQKNNETSVEPAIVGKTLPKNRPVCSQSVHVKICRFDSKINRLERSSFSSFAQTVGRTVLWAFDRNQERTAIRNLKRRPY